MPLNPRQLGLLLGLTALSVPAVAQDPAVDVNAKIRFGLQTEQPKDQLAKRMLGMGFGVGFNTGIGRFGIEAGWSYKTGDHYLVDTKTIPVAPGKALIPGKAVDSRKNELQGLAVRLSYEKKFTESLGFIIGAQVGGTSFRQEYVADLQGGVAPTTSSSTATFRDTYNGTPKKTTTSPSPFLGLTYRINDFSSLEFNVLMLRYTAIDYVHQAGYVAGLNRDTSRDSLTENTRTAPHLEVGYVFRF